MAVSIVTDTTHYLPRDLVEEKGIHQVSLYVNWQGRTDREADFDDFDDYYGHLQIAEDLPTTSQPSVGDFLEVYRPLLEQGDDIVSVHLSGGISGTCESATQAAKQLVEEGFSKSRITLVDSKTAAGGLAFVVLAACEQASQGRSAKEVAEACERVSDDVKIWFAVDTLEFLRRGGRIGAARAMVGSTLKIKPILTLEAEITPVDRVRTSGRVVAKLTDLLRERWEDGCDRWGVQHVRDPARAAKLVEQGCKIFGNEPDYVTEVGPVIGTHVGPGLLGVSAVRGELLGPR
jgi:DegV family protein with EDD domain